MTNFDLEAGERLKKEALDNFELTASEWLTQARAVAIEHAKIFGYVTVDDVIGRTGKPVNHHHNVIGAIFATGQFRRVGYTKTRRPEGHARIIGVWEVDD